MTSGASTLVIASGSVFRLGTDTTTLGKRGVESTLVTGRAFMTTTSRMKWEFLVLLIIYTFGLLWIHYQPEVMKGMDTGYECGIFHVGEISYTFLFHPVQALTEWLIPKLNDVSIYFRDAIAEFIADIRAIADILSFQGVSDAFKALWDMVITMIGFVVNVPSISIPYLNEGLTRIYDIIVCFATLVRDFVISIIELTIISEDCSFCEFDEFNECTLVQSAAPGITPNCNQCREFEDMFFNCVKIFFLSFLNEDVIPLDGLNDFWDLACDFLACVFKLWKRPFFIASGLIDHFVNDNDCVTIEEMFEHLGLWVLDIGECLLAFLDLITGGNLDDIIDFILEFFFNVVYVVVHSFEGAIACSEDEFFQACLDDYPGNCVNEASGATAGLQTCFEDFGTCLNDPVGIPLFQFLFTEPPGFGFSFWDVIVGIMFVIDNIVCPVAQMIDCGELAGLQAEAFDKIAFFGACVKTEVPQLEDFGLAIEGFANVLRALRDHTLDMVDCASQSFNELVGVIALLCCFFCFFDPSACDALLDRNVEFVDAKDYQGKYGGRTIDLLNHFPFNPYELDMQNKTDRYKFWSTGLETMQVDRETSCGRILYTGSPYDIAVDYKDSWMDTALYKLCMIILNEAIVKEEEAMQRGVTREIDINRWMDFQRIYFNMLEYMFEGYDTLTSRMPKFKKTDTPNPIFELRRLTRERNEEKRREEYERKRNAERDDKKRDGPDHQSHHSSSLYTDFDPQKFIQEEEDRIFNETRYTSMGNYHGQNYTGMLKSISNFMRLDKGLNHMRKYAMSKFFVNYTTYNNPPTAVVFYARSAWDRVKKTQYYAVFNESLSKLSSIKKRYHQKVREEYNNAGFVNESIKMHFVPSNATDQRFISRMTALNDEMKIELQKEYKLMMNGIHKLHKSNSTQRAPNKYASKKRGYSQRQEDKEAGLVVRTGIAGSQLEIFNKNERDKKKRFSLVPLEYLENSPTPFLERTLEEHSKRSENAAKLFNYMTGFYKNITTGVEGLAFNTSYEFLDKHYRISTWKTAQIIAVMNETLSKGKYFELTEWILGNNGYIIGEGYVSRERYDEYMRQTEVYRKSIITRMVVGDYDVRAPRRFLPLLMPEFSNTFPFKRTNMSRITEYIASEYENRKSMERAKKDVTFVDQEQVERSEASILMKDDVFNRRRAVSRLKEEHRIISRAEAEATTPSDFNFILINASDAVLNVLFKTGTYVFASVENYIERFINYEFRNFFETTFSDWFDEIIHCEYPLNVNGSTPYNPACIGLFPTYLLSWVKPPPHGGFPLQLPWPNELIAENCTKTYNGDLSILSFTLNDNCLLSNGQPKPLCPDCDVCRRDYYLCSDLGFRDGLDTALFTLGALPTIVNEYYVGGIPVRSLETVFSILMLPMIVVLGPLIFVIYFLSAILFWVLYVTFETLSWGLILIFLMLIVLFIFPGTISTFPMFYLVISTFIVAWGINEWVFQVPLATFDIIGWMLALVDFVETDKIASVAFPVNMDSFRARLERFHYQGDPIPSVDVFCYIWTASNFAFVVMAFYILYWIMLFGYRISISGLVFGMDVVGNVGDTGQRLGFTNTLTGMMSSASTRAKTTLMAHYDSAIGNALKTLERTDKKIEDIDNIMRDLIMHQTEITKYLISVNPRDTGHFNKFLVVGNRLLSDRYNVRTNVVRSISMGSTERITTGYIPLNNITISQQMNDVESGPSQSEIDDIIVTNDFVNNEDITRDEAKMLGVFQQKRPPTKKED